MSCRTRSCCLATPCPLCVPRDLSSMRPFERRCDRPYKNLSEVHHAGAAGLNATFRPGTLWENGPFTEGTDPTIVRILCKGAYSDGENYSKRPEDSCALGNPCWFIACEVVRSPFGRKEQYVGGMPPHTLVPHIGCGTCHSCGDGHASYNTTAGVLQSMRAENETLRETIREQAAEVTRAGDRLHAALARANEAETKLRAIRAVLPR